MTNTSKQVEIDHVREKLIELANDVLLYLPWGEIQKDTAERIADRMMDHGVTVHEWISVKDEQKPKDRKRYFIAYVFGDSDIHFFGEAMYHAFEGNGLVDRPHFSNEGVEDMRVTHWMEIPNLPQPPKGE